MRPLHYIKLNSAASPSCTGQCGKRRVVARGFPSCGDQCPPGSQLPAECLRAEEERRRRGGNSSMLLLLLSGILFAFLFVFWKSRFQSSVGEMSSNSTSLALVRPTSSTGSTKSNTDKSLSVNSLSREILINFPHTIAMQKQILVNLRIVEYKLAELELFLVFKDLNGALVNWKSTDRD
ncbi:Kita-kyushu lung cancer antigen 1 homolog [Vulpes lagopus]